MSASDGWVACCRVGLGDTTLAAAANIDLTDPRSGELVYSFFVNILFVLSLTVLSFV
jgi:hypothetical protein